MAIDSNDLNIVMQKHRIAASIVSNFQKGDFDNNTNTVESLQTHNWPNGDKFSRYEIVKFFQDLAVLGYGRFVIGRRGQKTRFEWRINPRELAQALAGETGNRIFSPQSPTPIAPHNDEVPTAAAPMPQTLNHRFILRPDFTVSFILPVDFTAVEARRIQQFIEALPMALAPQSVG